MRTRLCHAMQGQGVFVCFCCAAPVVREKRRQGDGLAARGEQPSQQASTSRAGATAVDRPPPARIRLLCVKRRVASAGPLSEHNSAFDIRAVRVRIEGDRASE